MKIGNIGIVIAGDESNFSAALRAKFYEIGAALEAGVEIGFGSCFRSVAIADQCLNIFRERGELFEMGYGAGAIRIMNVRNDAKDRGGHLVID